MCNVQHLKISKFNVVFGLDFESLGSNERVDLICKESGRPDSRAKKKVPPHDYVPLSCVELMFVHFGPQAINSGETFVSVRGFCASSKLLMPWPGPATRSSSYQVAHPELWRHHREKPPATLSSPFESGSRAKTRRTPTLP